MSPGKRPSQLDPNPLQSESQDHDYAAEEGKESAELTHAER